jgi:hypothetical protein
MPKVFYVGGGVHSRGMLRAVISTDELDSVTGGTDTKFIGKCFPPGDSDPGTVVEVSPDEHNEKWSKGFFHLSIPPIDFDERLRLLAQAAPRPTTTPKPKADHHFFHRFMQNIRLGP